MKDKVFKIAILAVGGQGGAVLTNWLVDVADRCGYAAQSTSVAGVAQRTGATIYYVEMAKRTNKTPVFSLSPAVGDVDMLVASELMEAGRAVSRGFVTEDKTTLICSTHRIYAVAEKIVPGDGRSQASEVEQRSRESARRFIGFDMDSIAAEAKTVISSTLLGAIAASEELPFPLEKFEQAIVASERGVDASLKGFRAAYARAKESDVPQTDRRNKPTNFPNVRLKGPEKQKQKYAVLVDEIASLPMQLQSIATLGLQKCISYQDIDYGKEYLRRLQQILRRDNPSEEFVLSKAAAKHIANAMCYNDVIQVADVKTSSLRPQRIRKELELNEAVLIRTTEYFHPRIEEFCGSLPKRVGMFIEQTPRLSKSIDKIVNRGQRIRTDSIFGFGLLWMIAGLRPFRRLMLRHYVEQEHLNNWCASAIEASKIDYSLAVEIIECRQLIKGYSDTHDRGQSKFHKVMSGAKIVEGRKDAALWVKRLREAALKDEKGEMLDGALKTLETL